MTPEDIKRAFLQAVNSYDKTTSGSLFQSYPDELRAFGEFDEEYYRALDESDFVVLSELLRNNSDLLKNRGYASEIMHDFATAGATEMIALLIELGVDINVPQSDLLPDRPIGTAAIHDRTETVRWLIEHGSDINYEWGGVPPRCVPLPSAIRNGNLEVVRLLVEAGAFLNVLDRTNRTPLTWALEYNQAAIAEYLRSKGALESHQIPGYKPPELKSPLVKYLENRGIYTPRLSWVPVIPGPLPIAIRWVEYDDWTALITDGMSSQPMKTPKGQEAFQFAELVLLLPLGLSSPQELKSDYDWAIQWLQQLAQYPFEHKTWLGQPVTIVANGDPPQPLAPNVPMTCWLLCAQKPPLARVKLADGKDVVFYTILPIHTAERDYERAFGSAALLQRFADHNVPERLAIDRPCTV